MTRRCTGLRGSCALREKHPPPCMTQGQVLADIGRGIADGTSKWRGGSEPPSLGRGVNPSGLVVVLVDAELVERERWAIRGDGSNVELGRQHVESLMAAPAGSTVVVYDGDTGTPIVRMGRDES